MGGAGSGIQTGNNTSAWPRGGAGVPSLTRCASGRCGAQNAFPWLPSLSQPVSRQDRGGAVRKRKGRRSRKARVCSTGRKKNMRGFGAKHAIQNPAPTPPSRELSSQTQHITQMHCHGRAGQHPEDCAGARPEAEEVKTRSALFSQPRRMATSWQRCLPAWARFETCSPFVASGPANRSLSCRTCLNTRCT